MPYSASLEKRFINEYLLRLSSLNQNMDRTFIEVLFDFFSGRKKHVGFKSILDSFRFSTDEFNDDKGVLTPELLGIIYEKRCLEKKTKGVFYTPRQIAEFMCRESLKNYIKNTVDISDEFFEDKSPLNISIDKAFEIDRLLSNIKVCDPAVGCGAFSLAMLREISLLRQRLTTFVSPDRTLYQLKRHAVENSIYGTDIDENAVAIAKKRLWLSMFNENMALEDIDEINFNLECGNALIGEVDFLIKENYFDIITANPPYIGEKGNKDIFQEARKGPYGKYYQGKMDYLYFFLHLALDIAKPSGELAFITTAYFPTAYGAEKLREDLRKRSSIRKMINLNEFRIFNSAAGQHNLIVFLCKALENKPAHVFEMKRSGLQNKKLTDYSILFNEEYAKLNVTEHSSLFYGKDHFIRITANGKDKIDKNLIKLKEMGIHLGKICSINNGAQTQADFLCESKYDIRDDKNSVVGDGIYVLDEANPRDFKVIEKISASKAENAYLKPFYKNSDIIKYSSNDKNSKHLLYLNKNSANINALPIIAEHLNRFRTIIFNASDNAPCLHRAKEERIFLEQKIIVPQRCKSNCFGYNEIPWYASADVYFITQKDKKFNLKYILALLNSNLYYHWFYRMGKRKGEYLELYNRPLSEVPILQASHEMQLKLAALVNTILGHLKIRSECKDEIGMIQSKIDGLILSILESGNNS